MCPHAEELYEFDEFRLSPREHLLERQNGERIRLTPKAIETLIFLVENNGHIVSKDELLDAVWPDTHVAESSLARNISALRKELGQSRTGHPYIETIPKIGYRFSADVKRRDFSPVKTVSSAGREPSFDHKGAIATNTEPNHAERSATNSRNFISRGVVIPCLIAGVLALGLFVGLRNSRPITGGGQELLPSLPFFRLTDELGSDEPTGWTTDGRLRFINRGSGGKWRQFVMDADGGNKEAIQDIPGLKQGFWSHDGAKVVFGKDDEAMYLADRDGRNEIKLPFRFSSNLDWAPDGSRFVFQTEHFTPKNAEICVYNVETRELVNLSKNPTFDGDPSWSPDGRHIAFTSVRDGNLEVYLMNADGGNIQRLTHNAAWDSFPVFSPDGTVIAFNSDRENEDSDVYIMRVDGSGVKQLTNWESDEGIKAGAWSPDGTMLAFWSSRPGNKDIYIMAVEPYRPNLLVADESSDLFSPSWSPDGNLIAYQAEATDGAAELRIYDVSTQKSRIVTKTARKSGEPAWSADGSRLAFHTKANGHSDILTVASGGTDFRRLTADPARDISPAWSPDGLRMVFVTNRGGDVAFNRLYLMNADGSDQKPITTGGWEFDPAWSPDGHHIAFAADRNDQPGHLLDIYLISPDGSNERRLYSGRGIDQYPSWSPDGSKLAFVAHADGNLEIYVINSDGSDLLRLTRNTAIDTHPEWSPDGKRIMFSSDRGGRMAIYEVEVDL